MATVPTKFGFLSLFPLNSSPIPPHQAYIACGMQWLKWFNILMIFFSKFLSVLFSYIYVLIRILSPVKVLGHTEKKNKRNNRRLHVYTWVFLKLLRVFVINYPLKNAESLLKFVFRKCKKTFKYAHFANHSTPSLVSKSACWKMKFYLMRGQTYQFAHF